MACCWRPGVIACIRSRWMCAIPAIRPAIPAVVGYAAFAFTMRPTGPAGHGKGKTLLKLARAEIGSKLGLESRRRAGRLAAGTRRQLRHPDPPGELRGCIGSWRRIARWGST